MLEAAIEKAKTLRSKYTVMQKDGSTYHLYTTRGKMLRINLDFYALDKHPDRGDHLYFSENLFNGLSEGLFSYQFSTEIGWPCARQPHDFLLNPKEFLILEYSDGTQAVRMGLPISWPASLTRNMSQIVESNMPTPTDGANSRTPSPSRGRWLRW